MKSVRLFVLLFTVLCIVITNAYNKPHDHSVINWDIAGYYAYLPAAFIYNDLDSYGFLPEMNKRYKMHLGADHYSLTYKPSTGKRINRYTHGVALFQWPFFTGAHIYAQHFSDYPTDGYSVPYQWGVALSATFYTAIGLWLLGVFLSRYVSRWPVIITLMIIALGTNLFIYASSRQGMSHNYLFFLYALVLNLTDKWYREPTHLKSIFLGAAVGLAVLIRPTDILISLFPLLWWYGNSRINKRTFNTKVIGQGITTAFLGFVLLLSSLLFYWKWATGSFIYYSYEGEGFNFLQPHIWEGLFSYQKGWFVYTPLALLGFIGMFFLWKKKDLRFYVLPFILYYSVTIYVLFSWWMWYYGGSFGSRVMIQSYAILALPIAVLFERIIGLKSALIKSLCAILVILGIALNQYQTWQYERTILHWSKMTKEYYWRVFLKDHVTDEDRSYLIEPF